MTMPTFEAPGPGAWELETAHFPKPFPKFGLEGLQRAFKKGFMEGTARYGLLLSHMELRLVNGFLYQQPAPFGAPAGAKGPPPKPVLWLLTRLHPGMRARIRACKTAFESRRWRRDLEEWDAVDKPAALAKHEALLAVDPAALDDAGLAAHVRACDAHIEEMIYLHHKYTIPCCVPVGDFLAHTAAWTAKDAREILALLRGSSRISLGFSADELEALAEAVRADPAAASILGGGDGGQGTLDALLAIDGAVGSMARAFVGRVAHRALGYAISDRTCGEQPTMLVKALRATVAGKFDVATACSSEEEARVRDAVPAEHRARFDELLVEARAVNRLRDERGLYADCWAIGIARRALVEVGRRLASRGLLHEAEHAVDLTASEATSLLSRGEGPGADVIQERVTWRQTKTAADCPRFLGGEPAPPPDVAILPAPAQRAGRAMDVMLGNLFKDGDRSSTKSVVRGIPVNSGTYEGIARRVDAPGDFHRLEQGDVLVTVSTAPYFNVVLPLLGAIVTDRGGQLCHAAIVAREYGIPGVVGTREATRLIEDGARVRVDGAAGEITVL